MTTEEKAKRANVTILNESYINLLKLKHGLEIQQGHHLTFVEVIDIVVAEAIKKHKI